MIQKGNQCKNKNMECQVTGVYDKPGQSDAKLGQREVKWKV